MAKKLSSVGSTAANFHDAMMELKQNKNIERALLSLAKVDEALKAIEAKNQPGKTEDDEDDTEYDRNLF